MTLIVAGIDPGPQQSAVVVWDGSRILHKAIEPNPYLRELIPSPVNVLAVEHLQCFGMAVGASVFETAYYIGELRWQAQFFNLTWRKILRTEVKMHWCGSARAKDANIRQAVIDALGEPGTKKAPGATYGIKADLWSALAIAVYAHRTTPD